MTRTQKPSVGRVVHVFCPRPGTTELYHAPAIITDPGDGSNVNLTVFHDSSSKPIEHRRGVPYADETAGFVPSHSWHWPEYVPPAPGARPAESESESESES